MKTVQAVLLLLYSIVSIECKKLFNLLDNHCSKYKLCIDKGLANQLFKHFTMSKLSKKLAVCLLNVSEARSKHLVDQIAKCAIVRRDDGKLSTTILNVFSDDIYNRSVITIAGQVCDCCFEHSQNNWTPPPLELRCFVNWSPLHF